MSERQAAICEYGPANSLRRTGGMPYKGIVEGAPPALGVTVCASTKLTVCAVATAVAGKPKQRTAKQRQLNP